MWADLQKLDRKKSQTNYSIPSVKVYRAGRRKIQYKREISFLSPAAGYWSWVSPVDPKATKPCPRSRPSGFSVHTETLIVPIESVHVWTYVCLYIHLWLSARVLDRVCVRAIRTTHVSRWLLATAGNPGPGADDDQKSDTFTRSAFTAHSPFSPCCTSLQTTEVHTLVHMLLLVIIQHGGFEYVVVKTVKTRGFHWWPQMFPTKIIFNYYFFLCIKSPCNLIKKS